MSIPTNLADAIAGIRDGSLGTQQAMIGDIVIDALTSLQITRTKQVTDKPVQAGFSVGVGVIDVPMEIEIGLIFANPDYSPEAFITAGLTGQLEALGSTWIEKRDKLYAKFQSREIVTVTTHDQGFSSFVISSVSDQYDSEEDWDGYIGTVTLSEFGTRNLDSVVDLENAATAAKAYVGEL